MRKLLYSLAAIVLVAVAIFAISRTTHAPSEATTVGLATKPQQGSLISPFEIMMNRTGTLPVESWDAH